MLILAFLATASAAGMGDLQAVLDAHYAQGKVDYAAIKETRALAPFTTWLASAPEPAAPAEAMAFWINAYNGLTIDTVASEWPIASIRDLDKGKVWDARSFTVAGKTVTLNDIEHKILRPMGDPRIHAAVNCASAGCPPLSSSIYTGSGLPGQLDAASTSWLAVNGLKVDPGAKKVTFNKIFDWYGEDFIKANDCGIEAGGPKTSAAACFASKHAPEDQAAFLKAGGYATGFHDYSWKVNGR